MANDGDGARGSGGVRTITGTSSGLWFCDISSTVWRCARRAQHAPRNSRVGLIHAKVVADFPRMLIFKPRRVQVNLQTPLMVNTGRKDPPPVVHVGPLAGFLGFLGPFDAGGFSCPWGGHLGPLSCPKERQGGRCAVRSIPQLPSPRRGGPGRPRWHGRPSGSGSGSGGSTRSIVVGCISRIRDARRRGARFCFTLSTPLGVAGGYENEMMCLETGRVETAPGSA